MHQGHDDVERFNRWANTYDRHWMQRVIFEPIQRTVLEMAAEQVARPAAILDVGCGTGKLLRSAEGLFPAARLVGVDAAPAMVRQAQTTNSRGGMIQVQQATAEQLPFPDASFDLVFSTMTFHHWQDQAKGAAEVARVLTPGGRWLLAEFVAAGLMKHIRRLLRLHQFPEPAQLERMLQSGGLKVVTQQRVTGLHGQVSVMAIGKAND